MERRHQEVPVVVDRRKRGRPPIAADDPSCVLALKVEGSLYDRVYQQASARRMTIQEWVRHLLRSAA